MSRGASVWGPIHTRELTVLKADLYAGSMARELRRFFPRGMNSVLILGNAGEAKFHFYSRQFLDLAGMVLTRTLQDARRGRNHVAEMKRRADRGNARLRRFDRMNFRRQSSAELLKHFDRFISTMNHFLPMMFAPLTIEEKLFPYARRLLAKYYRGRQLVKAQEDVTTPINPVPVVQLELDLMKLLLKKTSQAALRRELSALRSQYRWLGMRFTDDEPVTVDNLLKRLREVRRGAWISRLRHLQQATEARANAFALTLEPMQAWQQRFFRLVNEYSSLKHERDTYRGTSYYFGHYLFQELRRRYRLSLDEILTHTIDDLRKLIRTGRHLPVDEMDRRQGHFLYLLLQGKRTLVSEPAEIAVLLRKHGAEDEGLGAVESAKGMTVFPGLVRGRARVIHLQHVRASLQAVRSGDILIAHSTKPEYVPAMKRAAAIITNEGGITCHAAIVSRELHIPCIVGTKVATKTFKDGDLIEVDATKGIVKKL